MQLIRRTLRALVTRVGILLVAPNEQYTPEYTLRASLIREEHESRLHFYLLLHTFTES
jgi:hypothetical protein